MLRNNLKFNKINILAMTNHIFYSESPEYLKFFQTNARQFKRLLNVKVFPLRVKMLLLITTYFSLWDYR